MLSPTEKRYLLAVLLTTEEGSTRLKKVSDFLKVKMPSAKQILEDLATKKFINYVRRGPISLTKKGMELAQKEMERFNNLKEFLKKILFLNEEEAEKGAWEIFFNLEESIADRVVDFMNFLTYCPQITPICIKGFKEYLETGKFPTLCRLRR
ncbi:MULTISPECIES: metal-dependent transcriptional regulator [unclassified Thermotoga]|uniref:metal-dependent transcriptional regulator n=1 Tax=unclassified Thermotoga TaxID=2631113 RepID=UPI0005424F73|nr:MULTISPECIES: metal-dependent transcriptional regulator [unclassified Thermotoga]KAF2959900.1 Fur family transcriptional regulator [Thermotoga sp. 38H-to]KHC90384.1 iron dependent repressor [Thermotoga sp. Mc24]